MRKTGGKGENNCILYTGYMIYRLIFVSSVILMSFPFVGVYIVWKVWIAFIIGILFFVYSVYSAVRYISDKSEGGGHKK